MAPNAMANQDLAPSVAQNCRMDVAVNVVLLPQFVEGHHLIISTGQAVMQQMQSLPLTLNSQLVVLVVLPLLLLLLLLLLLPLPRLLLLPQVQELLDQLLDIGIVVRQAAVGEEKLLSMLLSETVLKMVLPSSAAMIRAFAMVEMPTCATAINL